MPAATHNNLLIIILMTYLMGIGDLTHVVVESVEILYLVFNGDISGGNFSIRSRCPRWQAISLAVHLFIELISLAQICNDLSHHCGHPPPASIK